MGDQEKDEPEAPVVSLQPWLQAIRQIVNEPVSPIVPDPPVQLLEWLFLGPMSCLQDLTKLQNELGITHILSTNRMPPSQIETLYWELRSHDLDHTIVEAEDNEHYDLLGCHWSECDTLFESISSSFQSSGDKSTHNKKVFVHCLAGMNRSGTLVAAAMMKYGGLDLIPTMRKLKQLRGRVMTNVAFQEQLVQFAASIGRLGKEPEPCHVNGNDDTSPINDDQSTPSKEWLQMFAKQEENQPL